MARKKYEFQSTTLFQETLEQMQSIGYKDSTLKSFRIKFMEIDYFMLEHSYVRYDSDVKNAYVQYIMNGSDYNNLNRYKQAKLRVAEILFQLQTTAKLPGPRKRNYMQFIGGLNQEIEQFMILQQKVLLRPITLKERTLHLRRLNVYLESHHIHLASELTKSLLLEYISSLNIYSKYVLRSTLTAIRKFLAFLYQNNKIAIDLSKTIPKCSVRSNEHLPTIYSKDEIHQLLNAIDRSNPKGKRDYAMLLLAARLGLRSSDICELKFTELNWVENRITLTQKKTGEWLELPLLTDVGTAIVDYLKYGRPESDEPYIFLKLTPPYDRATGATFNSFIRSGMNRAGIQRILGRKRGPHALRHSMASFLLARHTPLPVITAILGHKNTESIKSYLRIDLESLRECTLDVPDFSVNIMREVCEYE